MESWKDEKIFPNTHILGSSGELLEEIKQMIEVLKHSETHVIKTANDSAHVRITATR